MSTAASYSNSKAQAKAALSSDSGLSIGLTLPAHREVSPAAPFPHQSWTFFGGGRTVEADVLRAACNGAGAVGDPSRPLPRRHLPHVRRHLPAGLAPEHPSTHPPAARPARPASAFPIFKKIRSFLRWSCVRQAMLRTCPAAGTPFAVAVGL